ncbi:MAG: DUF1365 domain-containing protein [Proteobacteria bacterium]|nr:DUF1365 domain-containing protein [Pseudomonadota bacterium]
MQSALYLGSVSHRRSGPRAHRFRYRTCLVWLDLAELDAVFAGRWLWSTRRPAPVRFRRRDFLGPHDRPLEAAVRDLVAARTGHRPAGAVFLLAHLSHFGFCFNPVVFYYCHDAAGALEAIVAEITNTPWQERHAYVLPVAAATREAGAHVWRFGKEFHVSPFLPMDLDYEWRFGEPGERLEVLMRNRRQGALVFDASLGLQRRPIGAASLALALARFPLLTAGVVAKIYWQALRLWLKRTPFHPHPERA